ncbi:hypothetical protein C9374_001769 [Naegleria lovaniensis]|uniref:Isopentenyl phosphate kinase n=1 Tax=Naegleria lovaniensis TaxID=51637 RepID=A0AA88GUV4_NAELO|nr:uncharacterized protein C9374_001769 [Naegleria lovaniensis]KAG2387437.1 hypothetical protein C9374_001769 [Naegleria lovaniensis]
MVNDLTTNDAETIAIKFGGSTTTTKDSLHCLNHENIEWMAQQVSELYHNKVHTKLIVVHGAGSFGHFEYAEVKRILQSEEYKNSENNLNSELIHRLQMKIAETRFYVQQLNKEIVHRLILNKIPAISISPFDCGGFVQGSEATKRIENLVELGYVPVIHGDLQLNSMEPRNFSVISGDTIMDELSRLGLSNRSIFVTDVFGVYLNCPSKESQLDEISATRGLIKRIRLLTNNEPICKYELDMYENSCTESEISTELKHQHDVTGGFEKKLSSAFSIARRGHQVYIVKAGTNYLEAAVTKKHEVCGRSTSSKFLGTIISSTM